MSLKKFSPSTYWNFIYVSVYLCVCVCVCVLGRGGQLGDGQ